MDESEFKKVTERLREVNAVIAELDPSLREGAWELLQSYVSVDSSSGKPSAARATKSKAKATPRKTQKKPEGADPEKSPISPPDEDEDKLVEDFESSEDAENLSLAIAVFYKRYGRGPFSLGLVKEIASSLGLEIPKRPDMTLKSRNNIRKQEDGWKIMPAGEKWLQDTYGVKRGKQPLP
jgi:hypothetical protein